ncbi:Heterokaryon incompatibility protein 6, OR allele [Cytospora mali]|uniref:Heterokaryon incompatibility protein 6, OR allele n=1 Tax=Cytospora mali TaxID=578113 RepID=A0A194VGV6_CYTMA|nr:Heterokaryon incompatibility protein 6, OR allele [Valsa mali var. pyri (nom. inval.)]
MIPYDANYSPPISTINHTTKHYRTSGNPKIVKPIFLEGRQVQVTTNLEAALRALHLCEETRHMWVDALCINQTDDVKKTHQVHLMSEIYKGTALALLGLGSVTADAQENEDEDSGSKISYIDAVNAFDFIRRIAEAGDDDHFVFDEDSSEAGAIQATQDSCNALWTLMGLSWWHRIWTVQEAVLPRRAIIPCDSLKLDWSTFVMASKAIRKHDEKECCIDLSSAQGLNLLRVWSSVNQIDYCRGTHLKFIDALRVHNTRTAGDSRDYLYALLGLDTNWGAQLSVLVDYSLSPQEVFYRLTTELIRLSNSLAPLIRLRQPSTDALLPTWVNDLSAAAASSGVIFNAMIVTVHQKEWHSLSKLVPRES